MNTFASPPPSSASLYSPQIYVRQVKKCTTRVHRKQNHSLRPTSCFKGSPLYPVFLPPTDFTSTNDRSPSNKSFNSLSDSLISDVSSGFQHCSKITQLTSAGNLVTEVLPQPKGIMGDNLIYYYYL